MKLTLPFAAAVCAATCLPAAAQTAPPPPTQNTAADWRQANDAVARIGGWRAYLREAQAPDAAASAPAAGQPLPAEAVVQLALAQHPAAAAQRAALALAEAELDQAGRMPNPGFSFARSSGGGEVEIERGLHFGLGKLIAMPWLHELHTRRVRQAEAEGAARLAEIATAARKAWVQAVAAEQSLVYAQQVQQATSTSAELARRMAQVGNFSVLQKLRELGFEAEATLALHRAVQGQQAAREQLIRATGVRFAQAAAWQLPATLPALPDAAPAAAGADITPDVPAGDAQAAARRADVAAAREHLAAAETDLALTRGTRFVQTTELGASRDSGTGRASARGFDIGIELPLFDNGSARIARADAARRQAEATAQLTETEALSRLRETRAALRGAWLVARHHRDVLLPLKRRISEQNLLRYNGMLIGVFELLADAREQIGAVHAALDAQRDYWLAAADFDAALGLAPAP